jgi:hypothetical protein
MEKSAPIGQEITFRWRTKDATHVWLEARGKRERVGLSGMIVVKVERDMEAMTLIARGPGGVSTTPLSVVPRHFGGLD